MSRLLDRCSGLPLRELTAGEVLVTEGASPDEMYVLASGTLQVSRHGSSVARISEPGSAIGEMSVLLETVAGATVTAVSDATVHVISDPQDFISSDSESLQEIARGLAIRLNRLVAYIADIKEQYADSGTHLGLLDEVLSELTFASQRTVESGSERDPDPLY